MKPFLPLCALLGWASWAAADDGTAARLAARYKLPEKEVLALRAKSLGWGEIDDALAISRRSGKPVSAIIAMHDKGMGWSAIAKKHGFTLGQLRQAAKAEADRAAKAARASKR